MLTCPNFSLSYLETLLVRNRLIFIFNLFLSSFLTPLMKTLLFPKHIIPYDDYIFSQSSCIINLRRELFPFPLSLDIEGVLIPLYQSGEARMSHSNKEILKCQCDTKVYFSLKTQSEASLWLFHLLLTLSLLGIIQPTRRDKN